MTTYSFRNDYSEGAHPRILQALIDCNLVQEAWYGEDHYCKEAADAIRTIIANPKSDVHFVSWGTQANLIVISSLLRPYESVIAAEAWHIAVHEAWAIEATGHKIHTVSSHDGKLRPIDIESVLAVHTDEHMVKPKLVFVSNSTETWSVYNKQELSSLSDFCANHKLFLYLDGARLGSALTSPDNDLNLEDISQLVDVFYIGGTKNGALLGEAIVINTPSLQENFRFHLKQKWALLAKGRVLGIQFLELFRDGLFWDLGKHANVMASKLAHGLQDRGYWFLTPPASNQIFPILPNNLITQLEKKYGFYVWHAVDENNSAIRLVTSWATEESAVDQFLDDVGQTLL